MATSNSALDDHMYTEILPTLTPSTNPSDDYMEILPTTTKSIEKEILPTPATSTKPMPLSKKLAALSEYKDVVVPRKENEDEEEENICTECGKTYQHMFSLKRHMIVQHSGDARPFECDICGKTFKLNGHLVQHKHLHSGKKGHECCFCLKIFNTSFAWKRHELTHALSWSKNECAICSTRFVSKHALRVHKFAKKCKGQAYTCCNITFQKKRDFLLHRIEKHQEEMRREYNCTHCDKKYSYAYLLELHQKIHVTSHRSSSSAPKAPRNGMVKCHICSEMFPDMKTLIAHSTATHENDKPYVCRTCGKGLTTKFAFQRHERMHTNERPYACSYCDKAFLDSESRRAHQRIHTGEKPFKCQFCDRTFSRSGNLQSHILTHTGEKPCICPVCNRGFAQHATLKGHLKTHGYICPVCNRGFAEHATLKGHLKTHGYEEMPKKKLKRKSDEDNSKEIKRLLLGKSSEMKKAVTSIRYERAAENPYDVYEDDDDNVVLEMQ